jgi:tripartite-type tricarboxylate transporter receptor subunit TctC
MKKGRAAKWRNFGWIFCMLILIGSLMLVPFGAAQEWPTKTITLIYGGAAGSVGDLSTRIVVDEMSKILGVPIVVVNMPGAGGGIGVHHAFSQPADGYTWHSQGSAFRTFATMGTHPAKPTDWHVLITVTYVDTICVRADSPYKTFPDLAEAIRKNPGKIAYSAAMPGTAYRLAMEIMKGATGLSAKFVTYTGSAPSGLAVLNGDVAFCSLGIGEVVELVRGKKLRPLAVFDTQPYNLAGFGEIPAITNYLPELKTHLPYQGYMMITMRSDIPKPILKKIDEVFLKAVKAKSLQEFSVQKHTPILGLAGDEAQELYQKYVRKESYLVYDLGVAKINPADFGIMRP